MECVINLSINLCSLIYIIISKDTVLKIFQKNKEFLDLLKNIIDIVKEIYTKGHNINKEYTIKDNIIREDHSKFKEKLVKNLDILKNSRQA